LARVAHFAFNLNTYSGAALQARLLARSIEEHSGLFFNIQYGQEQLKLETDATGFRYCHLPAKPLINLPYCLWALTRHQVQIIHLHGVVPAGLLAGYLLRIPTVLKTTLMGNDDFNSLRALKYGPLLEFLAKKVAINVVLSRVAEEVNSRHLDNDRVRLIPNGVTLPVTIGKKFNPWFCTVGAVTPRKRTHVVIERFLKAYGTNPAAKLFVVGPDNDDESLVDREKGYAQRCRDLAGSSGQIQFTGQLTQEQLAEVYETCLGFLSFSKSEGMPNALLEAMAANCVPIVGALGGVAEEIIEHGVSGFTLKEDDALPTLDEVVCRSKNKAARNRIKAAYDIRLIARRYGELYRELTNS